MSIWENRLNEVKIMLENGETFESIGEHYGVTKQRIHQIVKKFLPTLTKKEFGAGKRRQIRIVKRLDEIKIKFNREHYSNLSDLERAQAVFFTRKRQNAKNGKWNWDITMSDLVWPTHCPILGIELDWFAEKTQENSPSIDRLDTHQGYVKGNVAIMSWRANRIKNNGTGKEHQKIADFLLKIGL